jgi:hypothetical protein
MDMFVLSSYSHDLQKVDILEVPPMSVRCVTSVSMKNLL